MQVLRKGMQFLIPVVLLMSWMRKGPECDYDELNISVVICDTYSIIYRSRSTTFRMTFGNYKLLFCMNDLLKSFVRTVHNLIYMHSWTIKHIDNWILKCIIHCVTFDIIKFHESFLINCFKRLPINILSFVIYFFFRF